MIPSPPKYQSLQILLSLLFLGISASTIAQEPVLMNNMYIYNNAKDTIRFSSLYQEGIGMFNTAMIHDTVQIDGLGKKEIVFFRSMTSFVSDHGGTFDIEEQTSMSKYEVWNLDTRELLFEVVTAFTTEVHRFDAYMDPPYVQGTASYSCSFSIDSIGNITISNAVEERNICQRGRMVVKDGKAEEQLVESLYPVFMGPVKEEGVYRFVGVEGLPISKVYQWKPKN